MDPQQETSDTFDRLLLTRLRADMAPAADAPGPLHPFFAALYEDMLAEPGAYGLPNVPFVAFWERPGLSAAEAEQHEALKADRQRARKAVFAWVELLYGLGSAGAPSGGAPSGGTPSGGTPSGADLSIPRAAYEKLTAATAKTLKTRALPPALERCGLSFSAGDPVKMTSSRFPGMPAALAALAQACAPVKDFGLYLFRRCDLAALDGKSAPAFDDALRFAPQPYQAEIAATDARLLALRFKREIFADGDMSYRLRYAKKGDTLVYWLRIRETFHADLVHYLRWKLHTDLTPRLFARLDDTCPGLADRVFAGLKPCAGCYGPNCMDRVRLERGGVVKDACKGEGWNQIGFDRANYENLWTVLEAFDALM